MQQPADHGFCNSDPSRVPILLIGLLVVVGPLAGFGSTLILLHREWMYRLSGTRSLLAALLYVLCGAAAAAAVTWVFWPQARKSADCNWGLAAIGTAPGWALVPSAAFFLYLGSVWAEWTSALAGAALAFCLAKIIPAGTETQRSGPQQQDVLFADIFRHEPWGWKPLALAVCIYSALFAVEGRSISVASALLAMSAFSLVWCYASTEVATAKQKKPILATRLVASTVLAVLFIAAALVPKVVEISVGATPGKVSPRQTAPPRPAAKAASNPAWVAIELWPKPRKTHVNRISLPEISLESHKLARPLVIRFQGPYWYLEGQQDRRGLQPHVAYGNPTAVNIYTNDGLPLVMEVHQKLSSPIRLVDCREIQVTILNADQRPGRISLGMVLTYSGAPGESSIFLGSDPVSSSPGDVSSLPASGKQELLAFHVPVHGKIDRFNEITVLFFPDLARSTLGSKIAIEQFELLPR